MNPFKSIGVAMLAPACMMMTAAAPGPASAEEAKDKPLQLAKVDLPRYMGKWYIVANIPYFLENGLVGSNTLYTLREDGKVVENFNAYKKDFNGELKTYEFVDTPDPKTEYAHWSVRLFWPLYVSQDTIYVDQDYQYTLIGYKNKKLGWIFARKPELPEDKYRELLAKFAEQGYDASQFRRVPQKPEEIGKPGFAPVE